MNKQSSKSSRSATSASAPAGRASFARLVSHLIPAFGLAMLAGALLISALGGLLPNTPMSTVAPLLPPRVAQAAPEAPTAVASTWLNGDRLPFNGADNGACAIRNGALLCWWQGSYTPVTQTTMTSGVSTVSLGWSWQQCLIRNGALLCWNDYITSNNTPVTVTGMTSGVTAVDVTYHHACAIRNGALLCWGDNSQGQLGIGTTGGSASTPVTATSMTSGVTAVSVGGPASIFGSNYRSCAIKDNDLYCWGYGYGNTPQLIPGLSGLTNIEVGPDPQATICVIRNGAASCQAPLGAGLTVTTPALSGGVTSIAVTNGSGAQISACAVRNGAVLCWGGKWQF